MTNGRLIVALTLIVLA
ncbi:unnamed protein product, partial [Allacma fusca]